MSRSRTKPRAAGRVRLLAPLVLVAAVTGCARQSSLDWAQMGPVLEPLPAGTPLRQPSTTREAAAPVGLAAGREADRSADEPPVIGQ